MHANTKSHKLVLFDIDGTLLKSSKSTNHLERFQYALKKVFQVDVGPVTDEFWSSKNYHGMGDRHIIWDMIKDYGVSRDTFVDKIGLVGDAFCEYLDSLTHDGPLYTAFPHAKQLCELVIKASHLSEGVLTGNLRHTASWKLKNAGYQDFAFGVYGHEADTRNDLARLVIPKAKIYFEKEFKPEEVIILGDTKKDVECARAIGATVVIVATGWNIKKSDFDDTIPDLLVDTLMDEHVLKLLDLS
jgi:phosphoglycolate phosphatase